MSIFDTIKNAVGIQARSETEHDGLRFVHLGSRPKKTLFADDPLARHDMPQANQIVERALNHGGFVAGGYARNAFLYYGCDAPQLRQRSVSNETYIKHRGGDIDIFFPDEATYEDTVAYAIEVTKGISVPTQESDGYGGMMTRQPRALVEHSPTYAAVQLTISDIKIQLIRCYFGTPEEVLTRFALVNSMFAVTKDETVYAVEALDSERRAELWIRRWSEVNPMSIHYVSKYQKKWSYDSLRCTAQVSITQRAVDIITGLIEKPYELASGKFYEPKDVVRSLEALARFMRGEDLIVIAGYSEPENNWAMKELLSRNPVCTRVGRGV